MTSPTTRRSPRSSRSPRSRSRRFRRGDHGPGGDGRCPPRRSGWDAIPGARGCTPESCGFRDHYADLADAGADVYGLSTQSTDEQAEAAERLHLPFPLLSDDGVRLAGPPLRLPTFEAGGRPRYNRITLVIAGGRIEHAFSPIFPPDAHAAEVLGWLRRHPA